MLCVIHVVCFAFLSMSLKDSHSILLVFTVAVGRFLTGMGIGGVGVKECVCCKGLGVMGGGWITVLATTVRMNKFFW